MEQASKSENNIINKNLRLPYELLSYISDLIITTSLNLISGGVKLISSIILPSRSKRKKNFPSELEPPKLKRSFHESQSSEEEDDLKPKKAITKEFNSKLDQDNQDEEPSINKPQPLEESTAQPPKIN